MILAADSDDQGKCVTLCPHDMFVTPDKTCVYECPEGFGPNSNSFACESCSLAIPNCEVCETAFGGWTTCSQCASGSVSDVYGLNCFVTAPLNAVIDQAGFYEFCDPHCELCEWDLEAQVPSCADCGGFFLAPDGSCIESCADEGLL